MAAAAASHAVSPSGPQQEGSNISSPLSEVDDKDANDEDMEEMHLDSRDNDDAAKPTNEPPLGGHHDDSDSESALSDARSVAHSDTHSDGNDTEAETERLYNTPLHQRQRDVVFENDDDAPDFEHSPSKLRKAALVDDDDDDDAAHDATPNGRGDAPNTPTKINKPTRPPGEGPDKGDSPEDSHLLDSQERKRKRSPAADNSDPEQPLRKRTGSVHDAPENPDGEDSTEKDAAHAGADDVDGNASPKKQSASAEDELPERETRASKKATRRSLRRKGSDDDEDTATGGDDEAADHDAEDDHDHQHDNADAEAEEEADAAAKSAEEGMLILSPMPKYFQWLTVTVSREETSRLQGLVAHRRHVWRVPR